MKTPLLIFTLLFIVPFIGHTQSSKNTISLLSGAEYQDKRRTGWNAEVHFNRQINASKFYTEFGINYSSLEYNKGYRAQFSNLCGYPYPNGAFVATDYYSSTVIQYQKQQSFRLQTGINYHILEKSKFTLSGGVNFINQMTFSSYQHGHYNLHSVNCEDSIPMAQSTFANNSSSYIRDQLTFLVQPHLDVAVQLSPKIYFRSRFSYYWRLLPQVRHAQFQANVGLSYQW